MTLAPKKQRIPFFQLVKAARSAGAKDAQRVAACITIGANADGTEETIAVWRDKRPDLFHPVVVDETGAGAGGR